MYGLIAMFPQKTTVDNHGGAGLQTAPRGKGHCCIPFDYLLLDLLVDGTYA